MINWIISNKDLAEALSYWATAFGIVVAVFAGVWGLWRYVQDRKVQRWLDARALYTEVIDVSIQYPELNGTFWKNVNPDDQASTYRYEFYIAKMLMAFEELIYTNQFNEYWREAIIIYIEDHIDYFFSKQYGRESLAYCEPLRDIILEVKKQHELTLKTNSSE
jgi:hypothetical protein